MLRLASRGLVIVFVFSAFLYVLIEQAIGTWLPTFNNEVLRLPTVMSIQTAEFSDALRKHDMITLRIAIVLLFGTLCSLVSGNSKTPELRFDQQLRDVFSFLRLRTY